VLCAHATEPIQAVAWRVVACWRVLMHQWRQEVLVLQQRRMEYRILMVVMGFHASPAVQVLAGQALSWWRFKLQKQKTGLRVLCAHATEPIQVVAWRVVACWRFRLQKQKTGLTVLCAHATEPIQAVAWRVVACWRFRNATEGTLVATPKLEMPGLPSFGF